MKYWYPLFEKHETSLTEYCCTDGLAIESTAGYVGNINTPNAKRENSLYLSPKYGNLIIKIFLKNSKKWLPRGIGQSRFALISIVSGTNGDNSNLATQHGA